MHDSILEILKNKSFFKKEDISAVLILCEELLHQEKILRSEIEQLTRKLIELQTRVNFYRTVNQPKLAE